MTTPRVVTRDLSERKAGEPEVERLRRENRGLKARLREIEEAHRGLPSAEGVAGLPSISILLTENVGELIRHLEHLPVVAREQGFRSAVEYAQTYVRLAIHSVWLQPSRNAIQERDRHRVLMMLERPWVDYLVLPDRRGRWARQELLNAVIDLGVSRSIHLLAERAKEIPVLPTVAPRHPVDAPAG